MNRSQLEQAAAFNCGLDPATIGQASDAELLAMLANWIGAGEWTESEVLELIADSDWHPEMTAGS